MNAPRPIFPIVVKLACGLAAAALSGCVGNPFGENKVDPTSPVAAEVAKLTRQDGKFPKFSSIPNPPTNLRPAPQYGRDARQVSQAAAALIAATEPNTWTLKDTESFAETARKDAGPSLDPANPADAEVFARELRERATPPPPR